MNDYLKKTKFLYNFMRKGMVHVNLQLLYRCNFRCGICSFWKDEYRDFPAMGLHDVEVISRQLKKLGPQIVSIGGGEPLLHKDIVDVVRLLARDHFPVMICNGWFMTPGLARELFRAGMCEISISLDYNDQQKHDAQRGMDGAFDRAVNALKILNENRVHPHQRVHMISVIMDDNLDQVEPLIRLSKKLGVTYLVTLYSDCRGRKIIRNSGADISSTLLALKKRYPEFVALRGYLGRFTEAVNSSGTSPCYAGRNLMNIDSRGNVTFCIDNMENPAGNILTDEIHEIKRRLLAKHRMNECARCWTSCRGSIETIMYGNDRLANMRDYHSMIRPMPLVKSGHGTV